MASITFAAAMLSRASSFFATLIAIAETIAAADLVATLKSGLTWTFFVVRTTDDGILSTESCQLADGKSSRPWARGGPGDLPGSPSMPLSCSRRERLSVQTHLTSQLGT